MRSLSIKNNWMNIIMTIHVYSYTNLCLDLEEITEWFRRSEWFWIDWKWLLSTTRLRFWPKMTTFGLNCTPLDNCFLGETTIFRSINSRNGSKFSSILIQIWIVSNSTNLIKWESTKIFVLEYLYFWISLKNVSFWSISIKWAF